MVAFLQDIEQIRHQGTDASLRVLRYLRINSAKQSPTFASNDGDCFVASLLAMTYFFPRIFETIHLNRKVKE
ncbi:MAG: hypothetical protein DRI77_11930 [Chloroflexi bacterium]|nr:MAG: hypothetical protein DRI77_11930 [Chloroflexota bacterium]